MKVRLIAIAAAALLLAAPAAQAAPFLSIPKAKRAIFKVITPNKATLDLGGGVLSYDTNVSRCFRLARNKVQCRWSATIYVRFNDGRPSITRSCYGNARATLRSTTIHSKRTSIVCNF